MRKILRFILLVLCALLLLTVALAAQANVTFTWDHDGIAVDGFEVILSPNVIPNDQDLTDPNLRIETVPDGTSRSTTVQNITIGQWWVRCLAYKNGVPIELRARSAFSNEISITVPAAPNNPTLNPPAAGSAMILFPMPNDRNVVVTVSLEKIPSMVPSGDSGLMGFSARDVQTRKLLAGFIAKRGVEN